jgi:hypothetical protein
MTGGREYLLGKNVTQTLSESMTVENYDVVGRCKLTAPEPV